MPNPESELVLPNLASELKAMSEHWLLFLVLGISMVVVGTIAIGWSCLATVTVAATMLLGFLMLGAGVAEVVTSFQAGRWSATLLHVVVGLLYGVVGLMIIDEPERSAVQLTLIIAIFLMVSGLFRIAFALVERFNGRGWVLLNGAITTLLGMMIYKQWPESSLWVIGLFVGIELIFNGWTWIMIALGLRKAATT